METTLVHDLTIPLDKYAVVSEQASLLQAMRTIRSVRDQYRMPRQSPRAVLVQNDVGQIVGQIGYLDFLSALEPKYNLLGDLDLLSRAGVSSEMVSSMLNHLQLWEGGLLPAARRAADIRVRDIMHSVTEAIDADATLAEAIHHLVVCQAVRCLVRRGEDIIGVLRLADVFDAVVDSVEAQFKSPLGENL
jgi:hypothetical protein